MKHALKNTMHPLLSPWTLSILHLGRNMFTLNLGNGVLVFNYWTTKRWCHSFICCLLTPNIDHSFLLWFVIWGLHCSKSFPFFLAFYYFISLGEQDGDQKERSMEKGTILFYLHALPTSLSPEWASGQAAVGSSSRSFSPPGPASGTLPPRGCCNSQAMVPL